MDRRKDIGIAPYRGARAMARTVPLVTEDGARFPPFTGSNDIGGEIGSRARRAMLA